MRGRPWRVGVGLGALALLVACADEGRPLPPLQAVAGRRAGGDREAPPSGPWTDGDMDRMASGVVAELGDGWSVQVGRMRWLAPGECLELGRCFGADPSSTYAFVALPPAARHPLWGGLATLDASGAICAPTTDGGCRQATSASWLLAEDEVVVLIGNTPPPARAFSYTGYLFGHAGPAGRDTIAGSLGASVDLLRSPRIGDSPFEVPLALVMTANASAMAMVREALVRAGVARGHVASLPIPGGARGALPGLDTAKADDFMLVERVALPERADALAEYATNAGATHARVLRLSPREPLAPAPIALDPPARRGDGRPERRDLNDALDQLERAARVAFATDGRAAPSILTTDDAWRRSGAIVAGGGLACLAARQSCAADEPDALALAASSAVPLAADGSSFFVAIGVNHAATGEATWTSVAVHAATDAAPPLAATTDADWTGSASALFAKAGVPFDPELAKRLYAIRFAWSCGGEPHCVDLAASARRLGTLAGDGARSASRGGASPGQALQVTERAYLDPSTRTAPAEGELVHPRVLVFR